MTGREPIPQGTLDLLVLSTLEQRPELHGFEISEAIGRRSGDVLQVEEGSLYPALQRLAAKGWVTAEWKLSPTKRRARYYRLTAPGRKQLGLEASAFERAVEAITRVMQAADVE